MLGTLTLQVFLTSLKQFYDGAPTAWACSERPLPGYCAQFLQLFWQPGFG